MFCEHFKLRILIGTPSLVDSPRDILFDTFAPTAPTTHNKIKIKKWL